MTLEEITTALQRVHDEYDASFGCELKVYGHGIVEVYADGCRVGRGLTFTEAFESAELGGES